MNLVSSLVKNTNKNLMQIQKDLRKNNPELHKQFEVNLKDRKYQLWQRGAMNKELHSQKMFEQKLNYIHSNPVKGKWMLSDDPASYYYSSAKYYETDDNSFSFLSHYIEYFGN